MTGFAELLMDWHRRCARDLPWRRTRDPYAVLVSEVMLQQTQVVRVRPAYHAFLERFPTVGALAAAPVGEVLRCWAGLGYNRRAVGLHRAAVAVVERHGGALPADLVALRALPGVGDYTARAVLAFAFSKPQAPVDTNVARVLARAVAGAPLGRAEAQRLADRAVPDDQPDWSQALMDLGATVCVARRPSCPSCPVLAVCAWQARGGAGRVADPAAASAVRARPQGVFAGSDRYHRGRLVDRLRHGPVPAQDLPAAAGLPDGDRLDLLAAGLITDGLAEWEGGCLQLPTSPGAS